jgi:hypothetical protein
VRDATFRPADLTTFCRLDDLGLEVAGQQLHPGHAVLLCRVLAYFDRPGTSNGPTEAINGRLEHLRGTAPASAT